MLDLLLYFGATLALTLAFATPLVLQFQREQPYGPQRVQLVFQPCEAERWNEAAVKDVLARQGELRPARAPDGSPIPKFMNVLMLPHEAEGAHEPAVLGYFELHPHTGHRPHIDGPALVQAAGCPITEIRVSPLASLVDARGRLLVDGLRPPAIPPAVRQALADIQVGQDDDAPEIDPDWGEPGLSLAERLFGWNTLEVLAMRTGNPDFPVNAIPAHAKANLHMRFVVGTDINDIIPALRRHLDAHGFSMVEVHPGRGEAFRATRSSGRARRSPAW